MIFDAGVFIAHENPSKRRVVLALVKRMREAGEHADTTETVLASQLRSVVLTTDPDDFRQLDTTVIGL